MYKLFRALSLTWALFALVGSGFAGGPDTNIVLPWIEVIGFFMLAFINFESGKKYAYILILLILASIIYDSKSLIQSPYLSWGDIQIRYQIPIGVLLYGMFSIWKLRPEKK